MEERERVYDILISSDDYSVIRLGEWSMFYRGRGREGMVLFVVSTNQCECVVVKMREERCIH